VPIAYLAAGRGDVALLFLHGGFADASFWDRQLTEFAANYRVVAVDLAGHGRSGRLRERWTLAAFGDDIRVVVEELDLERVVMIGNSMGGPVGLEAARIMPERVVAVIGVDTLHSAATTIDGERWRDYVQSFRDDFKGTCSAMARALFHADAPPELVEDVRRRMCEADPPVPLEILDAFQGYDMAEAMQAVEVPIRSINGDLYPTDVEGNQAIADFGAVIIEGAGHYPMLEMPDEFNHRLGAMLERLGF
jgi:pimeloyl-ACP methyl ester carboxylesterase